MRPVLIKLLAWSAPFAVGGAAWAARAAWAVEHRVTVVETVQHGMEDDLHEIKKDIKELLKRGR